MSNAHRADGWRGVVLARQRERFWAIGPVALVCLSMAIVVVTNTGSRAFGAAPSQRAPCHERPAFRVETTRVFDTWVLPDSVVRSSTADLTRGCWWITSVRQFAPAPGVSVQQGAADLVAALQEQGYDLRRMPSEEFSIWRAHDCRHYLECDLTIAVVDSSEPYSIEAEFLHRRSHCHEEVVAFRVETAHVFDAWVLPDSVAPSSVADRASAGPCWWILSVRQFVPKEGASLRRAAVDLVAALRERGYELKRVGDENFPYWHAKNCPAYPGCELTIWYVDYVERPRLDAEFLR